MKIYTKRGDDGTTSTYGGRKLPKHHLKIEAYGSVDELNSTLGSLRDMDIDPGFRKEIIDIQDRLFTIGSHLASDPGKDQKLPVLRENMINELEVSIDKMDETLPEMKNFLLPGGHPVVSACHVCRCVCRRAERAVTHLGEMEEIHPVILPYMNRLSDYLFVLGRKMANDLGISEVPWIPEFE